MSKSLCLKVLRYTKYFVELCKGTGRICESDLSAPKTLTDLENLFTPTSSQSSLRWGEHSNSGMCKKACVCHENFVRHRVYGQGMSAVVSAYLIQDSIIVRTVLLDHRQFSGFSGCVNSMNTSVECDRVRATANLQRCNYLMALQVKDHQFCISATDRKEPSLLGINCHSGWPFARSKRPLPYY